MLYMYSTAITYDIECTGGCLKLYIALPLSVTLSVQVGVYAVQHYHYL